MQPALDPALTELSLERLRERRSVKWARYPEDVLPAWVAELDFPLAEPVQRALGEAVERGDTGYAAPAELGLGEAFAAFAAERFGWSVEAGAVTPSPDVVAAIRALLAELCDPGDRVVIDPPVYHPFFAVLEELGLEAAEAPLREGRLDPEAIEARFAEGAAALLLCSPQNPTGDVPGAAELEAVAAAAARHGAWVIADEIHAPLTLPGARHIPFLSVSAAARERGVALWSASKAFNVAGLGCAQIVTASAAAAGLVGRLTHGARSCGHLGAIAAVAAYREGGPWLDRVLAVLDHNRALLAELLAAQVPAAGYEPPRAGYLAWLDLRRLGLGENPAAAILVQGKLALSPGPGFGRQGAGFARLNFGTSPAFVEEAVARLARARSD
ncbi:MAG: aminotransferase class I/II-fold pyridoxal phosphate-dependent enzyme [Solirubrobacterales bacterium]